MSKGHLGNIRFGLFIVFDSNVQLAVLQVPYHQGTIPSPRYIHFTTSHPSCFTSITHEPNSIAPSSVIVQKFKKFKIYCNFGGSRSIFYKYMHAWTIFPSRQNNWKGQSCRCGKSDCKIEEDMRTFGRAHPNDPPPGYTIQRHVD